MDVFDPQKRRDVMSRVRSKNTKPEIRVRKYLHRRGLRYRIHDRRLPGCPDLTFPSRKVALFVHGCFWHGHEGCRKSTMPTTRTEFWRAKIAANRVRDAEVGSKLDALGWRVLVVWECGLREPLLD